MFDDSLLESGNRFRTKRGATTALSAVLQSMILGALVLLPLLYTDALPRMQMLGPLPAPPPRAAPPQAPKVRHASPVISQLHDGKLVVPLSMPKHAISIQDPTPPSTMAIGGPPGVEHSTGPAGPDSTILSMLTPHTSVPPPPRTERVALSGGVTEGHLIRRVEPVYPIPARQARIEGDVVLRAVIGRDGTIEKLTVVSGHPFLAPAAVEAVRQWRYQPFLLSGRGIEVDTEVLVRFRLSRNR
ncbi:MAG TPA: TonB family protein [Terriglobales bacterium]|nr:TonB family protein [Terriglobales bacterium]